MQKLLSVHYHVSREVGGITKASSAGVLPCGRHQVHDMRRGLTSTSTMDPFDMYRGLTSTSIMDPLFTMMRMCKEGEGKKSPDAFVQIVTESPFPMMLLAFDWTLDDLVWFCTPPATFSIMGIDPTFNLGALDVTVTTYSHLLLTAQGHECKHPSFIGPLFIHVKNDFQAYHFFASSLVSKRPDLAKLRCYGTDGETA